MIEWLDVGKKIQREDISKVEKEFGVNFPTDYIECVLENHGGSPDPDAYDFKGEKEAVFDRLLSYDPNQPHYILRNYRAIKDRLPTDIFPIASDPFGNFICLDYRVDKEKPKIVFWDHEKHSRRLAITPICDSFTELISKLYEPDHSDVDELLRKEFSDLE
ncbi:SMI1/KNR4 family protein [Paludifilum halophilum]|uniref:SMI1/KNR4 family protein n=1 Tax=Paludifilum halophilum TaxID=1642702 RepID=UPI00146A50AE|nr:SMI1/KNR4 family protein [Paludifilum halophilum]